MKCLKLLFSLALLPMMTFGQAFTIGDPAFNNEVVAAGGGGGGDNIAFRSKSQSISGSSNGTTVTEPASAANNDVFLALAICENTSTSLGAPAGWTVLYSGVGSGGTGFDFRYNLAWIRRGGSAPSLTWTMSTATYVEVHVLDYSGVTTTGNPYETSADGGLSVSTSDPDPPSVTTSTANDWVVAFAVDWAGSGTAWVAPTGYTRRTDNTAGNDGVAADKKVTAAGAENPGTFTGRGAGSQTKWTATVALKSS